MTTRFPTAHSVRCCPGTAHRRPARSEAVFKRVPVTMTWLAPDALDTVDDVYAAAVVPFTEDGDVVVARLRRGVEIPGGTVEPSDVTLEDTVRREAWEEARVVLGDLTLVHVVRMTPRQGGPARHVAVYAGMVTWMPPFVREAESLDRLVLTPRQFVADTTSFAGPSSRRDLLASAWTAVTCPRASALAH